MTELKPCPFCGENGEEIQDFTYYIPGNIYIGVFYCRNCGGAMIDTDKSHCWLDRAKLWNKRFCADGKGEQTMPDREKIIKGLEELERFFFKEYENIKAEESKIYYDRFKSLSDAIALLKEQETVEHAKEILCANGWEKMRYPDGMICKWDDPEIVRCKDCWKREYDNCPFYESFDYKPADDWFCADGERR